MPQYEWRPYVTVAKRRAIAAREAKKRRKRGETIEPVQIEGRTIARTFWGRAWCEHLEGFGDYANRLPRGRTYVRNGSVVHLGVEEGEVRALVMGSELYEVRLVIRELGKTRWRAVKRRCSGGVGSLLELLEGRLSERVMAVVTDRDAGLFPSPKEIQLSCTCPDWATMCKHVAAAVYAVGARLDERPELLFRLRGVDHGELIATDADAIAAVTGDRSGSGRRRIADGDLADVFGIELSDQDARPDAPAKPKAQRTSGRARAKPDTRRGAATRGATRGRSTPGAAEEGVGRRPAARDGRTPAPRAEEPPASPPASFTGAAVARLRARFEMSASEFARLLGVSGATIGNWERTRGRLGLQQRTLDALQAAAVLSKAQARRRLRSRR